LAPTTMKNAAKCDTSCELQNLVSHQNFERNLRFLVKHVCWSVCFIPTEATYSCSTPLKSFRRRLSRTASLPVLVMLRWNTIFGAIYLAPNMTWNNFLWRQKKKPLIPVTWFYTKFFSRRVYPWLIWNRTSNQARWPAEFKHINKRRKRN